MKVYVGYRRYKGTDRVEYGMTVYRDDGTVANSSTTVEEDEGSKFSKPINSLMWAVKKLKGLVQRRVLPENEPIIIFIGGRTLYTWLEKETAPAPYTLSFNDLMLELSFVINPVEIIYSKGCNARVLFRNTEVERTVRATDLFKNLS